MERIRAMELTPCSPLLALSGAQWVALAFAGAIVSVVATAYVMKRLERGRAEKYEKELEALKSAANAEAERIKAKAEADAQAEFIRRREQFDRETEKTRQELRGEEKRISKREDLIDQKLETINSKERMVETAQRAVAEKEKSLASKDRHLNEVIAQQKSQLLKVANLSLEEAREMLLGRVEKEMQKETSQLVEKRLQEAQETAETQARDLIVQAIQRYAAEHTCDTTVSAVEITSDDMKGRVIGREGRNIRAFEKATGVDVIVDDTPGVVVVSAFDPVRREIARRSLDKLIQDGRIHPTRIEEVVANVEKDIKKQIQECGKQAVGDASIRGVHGKLTELLGRLHVRTS
jgi:ribonuclease Y